MAQLVLEGTWEEIARQADQLAGKRVRLTVLDAPEGMPSGVGGTSEAPRTLAEILSPIHEETRRLGYTDEEIDQEIDEAIREHRRDRAEKRRNGAP